MVLSCRDWCHHVAIELGTAHSARTPRRVTPRELYPTVCCLNPREEQWMPSWCASNTLKYRSSCVYLRGTPLTCVEWEHNENNSFGAAHFTDQLHSTAHFSLPISLLTGQWWGDICMHGEAKTILCTIHSFIHSYHSYHSFHVTSRHVPSRPVPSRPVPSRPVLSRHVTSRHAIMPSCHHVIISSCHHVISFRSIRFHSIPSVLFPSESCIRYCIRNTVHMSAIRTWIVLCLQPGCNTRWTGGPLPHPCSYELGCGP